MSPVDRRQFVALLAAAGTGVLRWPRAGDRDLRFPSAASATSPASAAVVVAAESSPFFAHPDSQRCLVRFFVSELDAPAGRMRVFDGARRQLGTAGIIPLGDGRLYGELWLPLGALERIRSELEAPGLRRPVATWHTLAPPPRWTLHWLTLLDPGRLDRHLRSLDHIPRAVEIAALRRIGAMVNPVPSPVPAAVGDLPFLRLAETGQRVAALTGIARGPVALVTETELGARSLAAVLVASGVTSVVLKDGPGAGLHWREGAEASRLLVAAVPAHATPEHLGFLEGGERMVRAVERLLLEGTEGTEGTGGTGGAPERIALVVGTDVAGAATAAESVREWNARFAHPHFVVGDAAAFFRAAPRSYAGDVSVWVPQPVAARATPTPDEVTDVAQRRAAESQRRAQAMIACLAPLVPGAGAGLERIAAQLAVPVPGTVVFNPTPYARTELVKMADGSERVATDIPPLGYAYFPLGTGDGGEWLAVEAAESGLAIGAARFRLALDPDSGAIRSLTSADGSEWANGSLGLNAVAGSRLEAARHEVLPGVGARIIARRRGPWRGEIRTVATVYERLPWIDVVNHADVGGDDAIAYRFSADLPTAAVEWEIPAGMERGTPPCDCTHLRWLRLSGERGSAMLAARQSALGHVDQDGTLVSHGPRGESRFRIGVSRAGAFALREDPWRFGWGIEPAVTAPVPGTRAGSLPTFGALLVVDQPGVAVVGLQPAEDGDGVIAYLQELGGLSRLATLGAGLIGFEDARQVDLVERDLGPPAMVMRNGVGVLLRAHGVAAVRLLGVKLAKA